MDTASAVSPAASRSAPSPAAVSPERSATAALRFACLAMLVSYLPFSGVNGILGTIGAATGASTSQLQWLTDAFSVALAGVVLSAGVLADRWGRRRVAQAGLALTATGSGVGFASSWLHGSAAVHLLWGGQAAAGIGGGVVMSSTLALVAATAADARARTRAIAAWAAAVVAGLGSGPFLTGAISDRVSYGWALLPVVVLALVVAALGARVVESAAPGRRGLDLPGQLAGGVAIVALITAVIEGGAHGWGSIPGVAGFVVAAVALSAFVIVERRSSSPLLPPALFASGGFSAAGAAATAVLFGLVGIVFVLSLVFSSEHLGDVQIAVRLGLLFAANAAGSLAAAPLQQRLGARAVLLAGLLTAAAGMATLATLGSSSGLGDLAGRLALTGAGSGLVMATCSAVAVQSVSGPIAGLAGAANNALRQLGAALGPAVLGALLASRLSAAASFPSALHTCALTVSALLVAVSAIAAALLVRRPTSA